MTATAGPTGLFSDQQIEQEIWQQRAAAQLPGVLAAGRGLPPVAWTVAVAGAVLAGRLPRPVRGLSHREAFEAWRHALGLARCVPAHADTDGAPPSGGVVTHLSAHGRRGGVRVHLTAVLLHNDDHNIEGRAGS